MNLIKAIESVDYVTLSSIPDSDDPCFNSGFTTTIKAIVPVQIHSCTGVVMLDPGYESTFVEGSQYAGVVIIYKG